MLAQPGRAAYPKGMAITATYDNVADRWDQSVSRLGYPKAYRDFLRSVVVPKGRVLDIGTGSGVFVRAWLACGGSKDVTLLDPSAGMLAAASRTVTGLGSRVELVQARLEDIEVSVEYDTVLAAHVIEHMRDPSDALRRIRRLLAPGGQALLVISRPHWCQWVLWPRYRHRWYGANTIAALADKEGLSVVRLHKFAAGPPRRTSIGYRLIKTGD